MLLTEIWKDFLECNKINEKLYILITYMKNLFIIFKFSCLKISKEKNHKINGMQNKSDKE